MGLYDQESYYRSTQSAVADRNLLSSFLMIIICVFTGLFLSHSLILEKEKFDLLDLAPCNHKKDHLIHFKIYVQSYVFIGIIVTA